MQRPGPKPAFNGDLTDAVDLDFYERELRAWEDEVIECDNRLKAELNKAHSRVEQVVDAGNPLTNLARADKDALEDFLRGLAAAPIPGPPGPAGADGVSNLDNVLLTVDGNVVADENGNLIVSGGTRV